MKQIIRNKRYLPIGLVSGAILLIFICNHYFGLADGPAIILVIFLSIILSSMLLWAYANRKADGTEWWQDDNASGWSSY